MGDCIFYVGDAIDPGYPPGWFDAILIGAVGLCAHQDFGGEMILKIFPILHSDCILMRVDSIKPSCQPEVVVFVERQGVRVFDRIRVGEQQ